VYNRERNAELHFTIKLPNGEITHITIRDEGNGTVAYGDFEGLSSFFFRLKGMKMLTWEYMCHQCKARFELPAPCRPAGEKEAKCPECGSMDVETLLTWEYVCHQCKAQFELPVPRGPADEKEAKCPECGSMDIERVNVCLCSIAPPGG